MSKELSVKKNVPFILFIEDDIEDQGFLKLAFDDTNKHCKLHFVSSGKEALEYLQLRQDRQLPDLIVMDYYLPGLNGWHLIQKLNADERFKEIEKVILSSSSCPPCALDNQCEEPIEHYTKPYTFHELKNLAENLLELCSTRTYHAI